MKRSAGILFYKMIREEFQVLLIHPGGPFWAKKDEGAWSIPKGEVEENEDPEIAAKREAEEELGIKIIKEMKALTPIKQKSGKLVMAWAVAMDIDVAAIKSNTFEMEWPPRSGKKQASPEIDKAAWFTTSEAGKKMIPAQLLLVKELEQLLK